jgi:uncharacterized protein YndB with AHSA1/START domain
MATEMVDQVVEFVRMVDAPRTLVWRMWTQERHVARWWQPGGFKKVAVERFDVRVGGGFRVRMPHESGIEYVSWATYTAVEEPGRIAYHEYCSEDGKVFHEADLEVLLEDEGGKTRVTIRAKMAGLAGRDAKWTAEAMKRGWAEGWGVNMGLLERQAVEMLPAGHRVTGAVEKVGVTMPGNDLVFSRVFEAGRELVFKAWTDPVMVAKWWGPHRLTNPVCEMDARAGGAYRITMRGPDGAEYPMRGVFLEVDAPRRVVMTDVMDEELVHKYRAAKSDQKEFSGVIEVVFEEAGQGRTKVTVVNKFKSRLDRDAIIKMGSVEGWSQSFEKLDGVIAEDCD